MLAQVHDCVRILATVRVHARHCCARLDKQVLAGLVWRKWLALDDADRRQVVGRARAEKQEIFSRIGGEKNRHAEDDAPEIEHRLPLLPA